MALYEHIFMARQDVSAQQVDQMIEQFKNLVAENGGTITKTENWGLKSLAFRIKKNRKAHYALMNIDAPSAAVQEMERQMRINEDILRFQTVRVLEHEDGPSVMLQKRDRDERPSRGGSRGERSERDE